MKLVNRAAGNWHYVLDQTKFVLLKKLLENFPSVVAEAAPPLSRTDTNPRMAERNQLLYMALADHRQELEQQAMNLLRAEKFVSAGEGKVLTISAQEREMLIQVLNAIRMGCWCELGRPPKLEPPSANASELELIAHALLEVAGYFEYCLIAPDLAE